MKKLICQLNLAIFKVVTSPFLFMCLKMFIMVFEKVSITGFGDQLLAAERLYLIYIYVMINFL